MSETMIERVAKALHRAADNRSEPDCRVAWGDCLPVYHQMLLSDARAAIEAIPLERLIVDAYVRGVEWKEENPLDLDREYRFKAARDYADKTLSQVTPSLPTLAATPTDSANTPPVESVGPNSDEAM